MTIVMRAHDKIMSAVISTFFFFSYKLLKKLSKGSASALVSEVYILAVVQKEKKGASQNDCRLQSLQKRFTFYFHNKRTSQTDRKLIIISTVLPHQSRLVCVVRIEQFRYQPS